MIFLFLNLKRLYNVRGKKSVGWETLNNNEYNRKSWKVED